MEAASNDTTGKLIAKVVDGLMVVTKLLQPVLPTANATAFIVTSLNDYKYSKLFLNGLSHASMALLVKCTQ